MQCLVILSGVTLRVKTASPRSKNLAMASNRNNPVTYDLTTAFEDEECTVIECTPTMRKAEKRGKLNAPAVASASPELRRRTTTESASDPDNTRIEDSSWLSDAETDAAVTAIAEPKPEETTSSVVATPLVKRPPPVTAPGAPARKKLKTATVNAATSKR